MALDVGIREIVFLEENRLIESTRQRVWEAVSENQAGAMATLAVCAKRITPDPGMFSVNRHDGDLGPGDEVVEIPVSCAPQRDSNIIEHSK